MSRSAEVFDSLAAMFALTPAQLRAAPLALIGPPGRHCVGLVTWAAYVTAATLTR